MAEPFAFVFPGQGSQFLGMLQELATQFPVVKATFKEASDALNYDLWKVVQEGPEDHLNQTEITQPAMLAADIAIFRCWQTLTAAKPAIMAGHSLGEYAALVAAEAMAFKDAVTLVAKRGFCMQAAVPVGIGAMAAIIGLDDEKIVALCHDAAAGQVVAPANFNSIGQVVIAGDLLAVQRAIEMAKPLGAKIAKMIPVSVPSHSPLMQPAAENFSQYLKNISIKSPVIPVIHNADISTQSDPEKIRELLIQQLVAPVRWVQTIQKMQADGLSLYIECGPGKVLGGLIKRIERTLVVMHTDHPDALNEATQAVM